MSPSSEQKKATEKTEEPSQPKKSGSICRVFRTLFCCCFDPRYWKQKIEK
eukprot:01305.XXX_3055_3266_1 [CDS] Oithona nana genome sequencing.